MCVRVFVYVCVRGLTTGLRGRDLEGGGGGGKGQDGSDGGNDTHDCFVVVVMARLAVCVL